LKAESFQKVNVNIIRKPAKFAKKSEKGCLKIRNAAHSLPLYKFLEP